MHHLAFILGAAAVSAQCVIPDEPPLSNTILEEFGIQVQNPSFPVIHNRFMYFWESGGGDEHLYLHPAGDPAFENTLHDGVLQSAQLFGVINGEYTETDNTTKLFMTERGDPRAIFQPVYGCNPDTDELQVELAFVERQGDPPGGHICVRLASGDRHEFRWSPPDNPTNDPERLCMQVTLVLADPSLAPPPPASTALPTGTEPPTPTPTLPPPPPFADLTSEGFAFVGCAPEEGQVTDPEDVPGRTLSGALLASDSLTNELCIDFCAERGFIFAGTEYSRECWCGNSVADTRVPGTTVESLSGCSMRCAGDGGQICGGSGWLSLYEACEEGEECVNAEFS